MIQAYAKSVDGKSRKPAKKKPSHSEELLEGVIDPVLKVRIKLLVAENASLRGQLLAARHLANQVSVLDLTDSPGQAPSNGGAGAEGFRLTYQEVLALESAISDATLAHWGWSIDETGRVVTANGQPVFRAGFATAVRKAIEHGANI